MSFPCSHCGSEESFSDRKADDFRPIVPIELQGDFSQPPEFISPPSSISIPHSTKSNTKPVSKSPVSKDPPDTSPIPPIVPSPKSDVKPGILEGPPKMSPQAPTSLKDSSMKEAYGISHVVERMVTKTEDTDYRTFVKHRLLEIETTIQSIQTDIQSLIKGQKHIESMLEEKEEQKSQKKSRWKK